MNIKEKRQKITEMILKTFRILDPSDYNYNLYKQKYEKMSDNEFMKDMKEFLEDDEQNFYLEYTPFDSKSDLKLENIMKAGEYLGIPMDEYLYMPYVNPNGKPLRSKYKIPVGWLHVKRLRVKCFLER